MSLSVSPPPVPSLSLTFIIISCVEVDPSFEVATTVIEWEIASS